MTSGGKADADENGQDSNADPDQVSSGHPAARLGALSGCSRATDSPRRWGQDGLPPNPGGWITTTARKRAIERLRRAARERELLGQMAASPSNDDPENTRRRDPRRMTGFASSSPAATRH